MAFLVGCLVHVEKRVDRLGVLAIGIEDDRVGRRFAERSAPTSASEPA